MSLDTVLYRIKTDFGIARLVHHNPFSKGPPVLFIHGFGSSGEVWFRYEDSLGNYLSLKGIDCWSLTLSNAVYANIIDLAENDLLTSLELVFEESQQKVTIISHSMGGIITRVMTSPNFQHSRELTRIEEMIFGIVLLTVPNQGITRGNRSKMEEFFNSVQQVLSKERVPPDLGLGFFQLTPKSQLLSRLNQDPILNPNLHWLNAIGRYDWIVPITSSSLPLANTPKSLNLKQKEFPCDHMTYPFDNTLKRLSQFAQRAILDNLDVPWDMIESKMIWRPAIHRHPPVGDWIISQFFPELIP
ncbi:MAG: alpha/beta fold hydrolase [Candidatus Heimdallarchaeota archaeon]